jgi:RNA polymerase-binding protein DksA
VKKAKGKKAKAGKRNPHTQTPTRKAPSVASQQPVQSPAEQKRPPKTYLTKKQLEEFRQLLLLKRAELVGDVDHLTREAFSRDGQGEGEHSAMPIHMADLGTDNWEKEFTLGLIENEQALIREIDAALSRITNRTYGMCLATHQQISLARLRAKPWAKYCIEYARAREEGRAR